MPSWTSKQDEVCVLYLIRIKRETLGVRCKKGSNKLFSVIEINWMKTSMKVIHWLPRILCILAILFISMFALDAFDPELNFWRQIGDFLLHMIPSFVLIIVLIIAWKREFIGGILFTIIGVAFTPFIYFHNYNMNQSVWLSLLIILLITMPFVLVGILFMVSHRMKKRNPLSSIEQEDRRQQNQNL